jgi:hypothetical protein
MGWDAFAIRTKCHIRTTFKQAEIDVRSKADSVDFGLHKGWLDCSACAKALEEATGESCWDEDGWSAAKVRRLATTATWPDEVADENKWAVYSAKAFLEACAKIGTGIRFSW